MRLWRLEGGEDVGDRAAWDVRVGQGSQPIGGGTRSQALGDQRPQLGARSRRDRRSWQSADRRPARLRRSPCRTAATAARNPRPRRSRRRSSRSSRTGRCSDGRCPAGPAPRPVANAFCAWLTSTASVEAEQRHVDALAARRPLGAPRQQPGQDPDRREQPGDDVADRDAHLRGMAAVRVGLAGDRHEPADRLDHEVVPGPVRRRSVGAVAADREVDEVGVQLPQRVVIETETSEGARPEILDEDVRVGQQPAQDLGAGGLAQVEPDGALVAVDRQVVGGGPRPGRVRRRPTAGPSRASRRPPVARP